MVTDVSHGSTMLRRPAPSHLRGLLDLQACQTEGSRGRGIGRYSLSLATALLADAAPFSFSVACNAAFPHAADELATELQPLTGADRFIRYHAMAPALPWDAGRL